ncbi:MAG: archease [Anaerolineaceae bacterium]
MNTKQGFKEIDNTADAAYHIWGDTLPALFQQAVYGLYALAGAQSAESPIVFKTITLEAEDMEILLVDFLSELLFYLNNGIQFQINKLEITGHCLEGRLAGGKVTEMRREIKAITYHQMQIIQSGDQFQTDIVLDI